MPTDRIILAPLVTRVVRSPAAVTRSVQGALALGSAALLDTGDDDDQVATGLDLRTRGQLVNLQMNSDFNVSTALTQQVKLIPGTTTAKPQINFSAYSTGSNTVVFTSPDMGDLREGDLVVFPNGVHAYLLFHRPFTGASSVSYRARSVTRTAGNAGTFAVRLPYGLAMPAGASVASYCLPITRGDSAGVTGGGPDWHSKDPTLQLWIEDAPSILPTGVRRGVVLRKTSSAPQLFYWNAAAPYGEAARIAPFCGRDLSRGQRVRRLNGQGSAHAFALHGAGTFVYGPEPTAAALDAGAWLEVTLSVAPGSTILLMGVELLGPVGAEFLLTEPMVAHGRRIGDGGYVPYRGRIPFITGQPPDTFFGATFSFPTALDPTGQVYSFAVDVRAESNGAYCEIEEFECEIEGTCTSGANVPLYGESRQTLPFVCGLQLYSQVQGQVASSNQCAQRLEDDSFYLLTSQSGATFQYVSIDTMAAWVGGGQRI